MMQCSECKRELDIEDNETPHILLFIVCKSFNGSAAFCDPLCLRSWSNKAFMHKAKSVKVVDVESVDVTGRVAQPAEVTDLNPG